MPKKIWNSRGERKCGAGKGTSGGVGGEMCKQAGHFPLKIQNARRPARH